MKLDQITKIPDWHNYFMSMAFLASTRSKDPSTKVGAVVAFEDKSFVTGYNGTPRGFDDSVMMDNNKYPYLIHAEMNALSLAGLQKCRNDPHAFLYVTIKPCPTCMIQIEHYGIKRIYYRSEYKSTVHNEEVIQNILKKGNRGLTLIKYCDDLIFEHSHMGIK